MSKPRKKHNLKARMDRACRALLKTNYACVANVEPPDQQVMLHWKHCTQIRNVQVANALCDIAHHWTIYISVFCRREDGQLYSKSIQFTTEGMHLVANLESEIEKYHADLCAGSNPNHTIGSGWIAIPNKVDLTEDQANRIFKAMGAWSQPKAA
ncbi:hypothetical protein H4C81_22465 [Pseudomonas monteilii]|uniref:hypothetical protein n=1 Tax=Pseudomonas monteilii TaxID=76759 RepID=UPI0015F796DB|nr:hypothetical protein [Pseudomonas monteilii]MBA6091612.1 hypothetical protein [Pseudomonas monteilii]